MLHNNGKQIIISSNLPVYLDTLNPTKIVVTYDMISRFYHRMYILVSFCHWTYKYTQNDFKKPKLY